jgi:hypothetical protein
MSAPAELAVGARVVRRAAVVEADVDGEVVALNAETAECYGLAGVGARIWRLLEAPRTLAELVGALVAEYEVSPTECERAVRTLLGEMLAERLIEAAPT